MASSITQRRLIAGNCITTVHVSPPPPPRLKLRTVKVKLEFQSGRFRVDLGKQSLCCSFAATESFDFPRSEAAKEVWS